jgi:Tfp pilus assembly protein FimT
MRNWIFGALAGLAMLVRGFFADRKAARLTNERDAARADAVTQGATAEAKAQEAAQLREQKKQEGTINAKDSADTANHLDNKHNW